MGQLAEIIGSDQRPAMMTDLLSIEETAEALRVSPRTLFGWRCKAYGPIPVRVGPRLIRYRAAEVERFLAEQHNEMIDECISRADEDHTQGARPLPGSPAREGQESWTVQSPAGSNQRLVSHSGRTRA
jgi:predicted DNA-binding transcriptional regulator AlpA